MNTLLLALLIPGLTGATPAKQSAEELIKAATTRPWPGRNYPELPELSAELKRNVRKEIDSSKAIRSAYSKLDASKRNISWFEGVAELEKERAIWSLLSCLCHPHDDVQIKALQALARMKDAQSLPFILTYADAMAVPEGGFENATTHGLIHQRLGETMAAITGLDIRIGRFQDPEGVKVAVKRSRNWLDGKSKANARKD